MEREDRLFFAKLHPGVLLIYFLCVIGLTMFSFHPLFSLLSFLGGLIFLGFLLSRRQWLRYFFIDLLMILVIAITNPLFSHYGVTVLFYLFDNPVTLESVFYGLNMAVMLVSVMVWFTCFGKIIAADQFLYLCGGSLPKTALTLTMAMKFIPQFQKQAVRIANAQKALGVYNDSSKKDKLKNQLRIFSTLLTDALENAVITAQSMRSRGFGTQKRSNYAAYRWRHSDFAFLVVFLLVLCGILFSLSFPELHFSFYPTIAKFQVTPVAIVAFCCFAAVVFLPFIIEVKGNLKWKFLMSRI